MNNYTEDEKEKQYGLDMGKTVMKNVLSWQGWGSPIGLGLFLVCLGAFLWMLHLANIIH